MRYADRGDVDGVLEAQVSGDVVGEGEDLVGGHQPRPRAEDVSVGRLDLGAVLEVVGGDVRDLVAVVVRDDRLPEENKGPTFSKGTELASVMSSGRLGRRVNVSLILMSRTFFRRSFSLSELSVADLLKCLRAWDSQGISPVERPKISHQPMGQGEVHA